MPIEPSTLRDGRLEGVGFPDDPAETALRSLALMSTVNFHLSRSRDPVDPTIARSRANAACPPAKDGIDSGRLNGPDRGSGRSFIAPVARVPRLFGRGSSCTVGGRVSSVKETWRKRS